MSLMHFQRLLEMWPWLHSLGLTLFALPLLAAAGAVGVSFFTAWSGRFSGEVFPDKLARQLADFGVIILGAWILAVLARWGLWAASWCPAGEASRLFYALLFDLPGYLTLAAGLASAALALTWRRGRQASGSHLLLGLGAAFFWAATLAAFIAAGFWRLGGIIPDAGLSLDGILAVFGCPLSWLIWGQLVFAAQALGAGFGLLYLLARRNREDYGRDYYTWGLRHCARWAIAAGVVQAGWAKAVFWRGVSMVQDRPAAADGGGVFAAILGHQGFPALSAALVLALLAWLCLAPVLRSRMPLRMKGWILIHAVLAVFSAAAFALTYAELF